jgi:hypothetical protein
VAANPILLERRCTLHGLVASTQCCQVQSFDRFLRAEVPSVPANRLSRIPIHELPTKKKAKVK